MTGGVESARAAAPAYAGFWLRSGATLLDAFALMVPIGLAGAALALSAPKLYEAPGTSFCLQFVAPGLVTLFFWRWKSATPGKWWLGLKIVRASDLGRPSLGAFIGRYLAYYLSLLPLGLGYFWVGWDDRKQGFHDKLAGTLVVREEAAGGSGPRVWTVILAVVIGLGLLLAAGIGAGVYWVGRNKDGIARRAAQMHTEAVAFAKERDNQACLDEALRRHDACASFMCHIQNGIFLLDALKASAPTPGFCDGVPPRTEFAKSAFWRIERCRAAGRGDDYCRELYGVVQRFCEKAGAAGPDQSTRS